ncbi:hypothetical protein FA10DRAFT_283696 [Acaromyces ingoldii]|uniref:Uncharacterized protein n=1 Tax=Acaromyces ingoldii TaxID=215250 RepID=A0A316YXV0_9BASI|nr:hypothetical protein FA10DRAFT_283696 [Acaromyces ingoldii]PWN94089.1 hypothetical protein FA10DRAFT_283696 [Acaromyces ingoldii]
MPRYPGHLFVAFALLISTLSAAQAAFDHGEALSPWSIRSEPVPPSSPPISNTSQQHPPNATNAVPQCDNPPCSSGPAFVPAPENKQGGLNQTKTPEASSSAGLDPKTKIANATTPTVTGPSTTPTNGTSLPPPYSKEEPKETHQATSSNATAQADSDSGSNEGQTSTMSALTPSTNPAIATTSLAAPTPPINTAAPVHPAKVTLSDGVLTVKSTVAANAVPSGGETTTVSSLSVGVDSKGSPTSSMVVQTLVVVKGPNTTSVVQVTASGPEIGQLGIAGSVGEHQFITSVWFTFFIAAFVGALALGAAAL